MLLLKRYEPHSSTPCNQTSQHARILLDTMGMQ
jgi:hypothetical protein